MDSELRASTIENFKDDRGSFVEELEAFSAGVVGDHGVEEMEADLIRISNTLWVWSFIPDAPNHSDHMCFKPRCLQLAAMIRKISENHLIVEKEIHFIARSIFDMLAIQVGRLTAQDYIEGDTEAARYAKMAGEEQRKWDSRPLSDDDDRMAYLREIWGRMHITMVECTCSQCWDLSLTPESSP